jgi:acetyl esterase/lipase
MNIVTIFIALCFFLISCKKNNSADTVTASPIRCNGRYDKDLFTAVKTTVNTEYGKALNIAGSQENLLLDMYEPAGDTATKRAMIIFIHGGGWTSGTKSQGKELCSMFAKKGYVAASIDYRLGIENPVNDKTRGEAVYRGVQDIKAAIRFARANASIYKIDPAQIFIGGYSAGAVNAIHAAYWNEYEVPPNIDKTRWDNLEGSGGNASFSSGVQAVFSIAGSIVNLSWIQGGEPPIVCVHSKTDKVEPYNEGLDGKGIYVYGGASIVQKANSINVSSTLFTFENIAHGDYLQSPNFTHTFSAISNFLRTKVICQ